MLRVIDSGPAYSTAAVILFSTNEVVIHVHVQLISICVCVFFFFFSLQCSFSNLTSSSATWESTLFCNLSVLSACFYVLAPPRLVYSTHSRHVQYLFFPFTTVYSPLDPKGGSWGCIVFGLSVCPPVRPAPKSAFKRTTSDQTHFKT